MSDMLERVARAINLSVWDETDLPPKGNVQRAFAIQHARAAIEAMREATDDMLSAAIPDCTVWAILQSDWAAMIDAALTTQTQGDGA